MDIEPLSGLEKGYDKSVWGPWKSHGLLLHEAIEGQKWGESATVLLRLFKENCRANECVMIESEFCLLLSDLLVNKDIDRYRPLFALLDRDQDGQLTEADFVAGALILSPETPHDLNSPGGQLRMQFIFLLYDSDRDGFLNVNELALLIDHISLLAGGQQVVPSQKALFEAKALIRLSSEKAMSYSKCFEAVRNNHLNGTSKLLRLTEDLTQASIRKNPKIAEGLNLVKLRTVQGWNQGTCGKLDENRNISLSSSPTTPPLILPAAPLHSRPSMIDPISGYKFQRNTSEGCKKPALSRVLQPERFQVIPNRDDETLVHLPLRIVRYLMDISKQAPIEWQNLTVLNDANELIQLSKQVTTILNDEDSLVNVPLPCRVYGDIHGQLPDLLQFFNSYSWPDRRRGDILSMNYVFLGDFVDRGAFSVEVVALMFALKILYPSKVFLVRGNHEDRAMNGLFGFKQNCYNHFGEQEGLNVWQAVNSAFDYLPLAAVIDKEVLCIHGGIGESVKRIDDLANIRKPIIVPAEAESVETLAKVDRVILDALWSDPTDNDRILGVHLSPRGQGACRFGPDKVEEFCLRNGIKLIIRAHECVQAGYEYFAGGRLLTVFSATSYCNQYTNDAAMIVLVRNENGDIEEHAQILKAGHPDTRLGWSDFQFRTPSPLRGRDN